MVYLRSWDEFAKEAQKLYDAKPDKVRSFTLVSLHQLKSGSAGPLLHTMEA